MSVRRAYEYLRGSVEAIVHRDELDFCGHVGVLEAALRESQQLAGNEAMVNGNAPGLVSRNHGSTAREAALAIYPGSGSDRAKVLAVIRASGSIGATRDEVAARTGLSPNTVRPRVKELLDHDFVIHTGRRRPSATGRPAEVLVVNGGG